MAAFTIEIAGYRAEIHSLFESTRDYCRDYLTEGAPGVRITVSREKMAREQQMLEEEARQEGFRLRRFTDPFLERAVIQRKLSEYLLKKNVLMLHGSVVAVDGKGYLFTAKSGTGKSTHTRNWCTLLGDRAQMVNDDKPFLRLDTEKILVCGSPWSGKHGLHSNITVPLQGICILRRGAENAIHPIAAAQAEPMLRWQSCPPLEETLLPQYEKLMVRLLHMVRFWQMDCTRDMAAAEMAFAAMSENFAD